MVNKAFSTSNFVLRHLVASVVNIAAPTLIALIAYLVLFVIAVFTGSGLGSPITLPLWLVFILLGSTLYTAVLLFPSTLIAEIVTHSFGKWKHLLSACRIFGSVHSFRYILVDDENCTNRRNAPNRILKEI